MSLLVDIALDAAFDFAVTRYRKEIVFAHFLSFASFGTVFANIEPIKPLHLQWVSDGVPSKSVPIGTTLIAEALRDMCSSDLKMI